MLSIQIHRALLGAANAMQVQPYWQSTVQACTTAYNTSMLEAGFASIVWINQVTNSVNTY